MSSAVLLALLLQSTPKALNATAITCQPAPTVCSYSDGTPKAGSWTYFAEASLNSVFSVPSNNATVTVPNDGKQHSVGIKFTPSTTTTAGVVHWVFRTSPPTGLTIKPQ